MAVGSRHEAENGEIRALVVEVYLTASFAERSLLEPSLLQERGKPRGRAFESSQRCLFMGPTFKED